MMSLKKGFTLIELLVVVAIIGILASVVLAGLNSARQRGRDARRMADLKQIQDALEMYYDDFGYYPKRNYAYTQFSGGSSCGDGTGGTGQWCSFKTDMAPYLPFIPGDPLGWQDSYRYYYDSDPNDNNQSYGFMLLFESSSNSSKEAGDGGYSGFSSYYEVGPQVSYCNSRYTGIDANWWNDINGDICAGGN